jgi:hypothetical protein
MVPVGPHAAAARISNERVCYEGSMNQVGSGQPASAANVPLAVAFTALRVWPLRRWLVAALAAAVAALTMGIPTDVVPTPLYRRMTSVVWWNYPIWAVSAVLVGLIAATYVRGGANRPSRHEGGRAFGGGLLSFLAVGCPICNKLVAAALGASGALAYFGPAQPSLGIAAVALLAGTLAIRLRGGVVCAVAPSR